MKMTSHKYTARKIVQRAITAYREQDGASNMGSYRDVVTDLLHIAFNDYELRKEYKVSDKEDNLNWSSHLKDQLNEAYLMFEEEREQAENSLVNKIHREDLPLLINEKWEFESSRELYEERLKKGQNKGRVMEIYTIPQTVKGTENGRTKK